MNKKIETINAMLDAIEAPFRVEKKEFWKNNNCREVLVLIPQDSDTFTSPTVPCDKLQDANPMMIVGFLMDIWDKNSFSVDFNLVKDKGYAFTNIVPKLVSKKNIPNLRQYDIIYHEYLDMCITYAVKVPTEQENACAQAQLTHELLSQYEWTEEDLKEIAICNVEANATIENFSEILHSFGFPASLDSPLWVISNRDRFNGSASILSQKVREDIQKALGEKVAILPSSIHECIAIPYDTERDLEEYLKMVKDINHAMVAEEERLTDTVYVLEDGILRTF